MSKSRASKRRARRAKEEYRSVRKHLRQNDINERIGYVGPLAGIYSPPTLIRRKANGN